MGMVYVPLDGSDLGERAIEVAASLVGPLQSQLTLIHVIEPPPFLDIDASNDTDLGRFVKLAQALVGNAHSVETLQLEGDPAEELVRLTHQRPDSLMVLATHGRTGLARTVFGSVTDRVLRGTHSAVVVTRHSTTRPGKRISTILVPLDGSILSEQSLPMALQLARTTGAGLVLVRVAEPGHVLPYVGAGSDIALAENLSKEAQHVARSYLDEKVRDVRSQGLRASWEVRTGRPADEIVRVAETTAADLIVMSTHGRGGLRRWALGSVMNDVLRSGTTPILVVPLGARPVGALTTTLDISESPDVDHVDRLNVANVRKPQSYRGDRADQRG